MVGFGDVANAKGPNQSENAVKIHTNGIESIWKDAKAQIKRMAGIARGSITTYLQEFMWRKMRTTHRSDAFNKIMCVLRDKYKLATKDHDDYADFTR